MSERLTSEWTDTTEEAYGASGKKGRIGELFMKKVFESWGWAVEDCEDDKSLQTKGIDLYFKAPTWHNKYSCDVKSNMSKYGSFFVYADWLFNPKHINDRYFHVNPDTGWVAWYGTEEMKTWYKANARGSDYIIITPADSPKFVSRRLSKVNV